MVSSISLTVSTARAMKCLFKSLGMQRVRRAVFLLSNPCSSHSVCTNFSSTCQARKSFNIENHDDFVKRVMNSDVPVIVNFHADWCDPCKILSPKLKELVEPMDDLHLAIIDVENNADLVHTFEVKAVPAVLAVRNGLVVDKFIGLVDTDMIEGLINKLTGKTKQEG